MKISVYIFRLLCLISLFINAVVAINFITIFEIKKGIIIHSFIWNVFGGIGLLILLIGGMITIDFVKELNGELNNERETSS